MENEQPAVKRLNVVFSVLSILSGVVTAILGLAAFGIAQQNTGTEGLAVMFIVALQWMVALVGGFILGGTAAASGRKLGLFMNVGSVVVTLIALIFYYKVVRL